MRTVHGGGTIAADRSLGIANNSSHSAFSVNTNCRCRSNIFNGIIGSSCHQFAFHVGSRRIVCHARGNVSIIGVNRGICCRRGRGRNVQVNGRCGGSLSGVLHTGPAVPVCGTSNDCAGTRSLGN